MIDKYHFVRGGAERYMFELAAILRNRGHEVIPFAMDHPDSVPSEYSDHFVSCIDYDVSRWLQKVTVGVRGLARMIYSSEARRKLAGLIERTRPDVAHLHMIDHQLSPSILLALRDHGVPALQTVHQYKLVCPNYRLFNPGTGKVCEKCVGSHLWHPIRERCHRDSRLAGLALALESSLHRRWNVYESNISLFHVPSRFMGEKLVEGGIQSRKVRHLPYTIELETFRPDSEPGDYVLYLGRLSAEKGIGTLLRAAAICSEVPLWIVGDGPMREELEGLVGELDLQRVRLLGRKEGPELAELARGARCVVVPSEWYENSPLVIYEAFAYGKPVIGSRMGGIPELVAEEGDGLLFEAGDARGLAACMKRLWEAPELAREMGRSGRAKAERELGPAPHCRKMLSWYEEIRGPVH